jgi:hypothetical protein
MPVLRDLSRDPLFPWKGRDNVTHELRLPDAARVSSDNDHAPMRWRIFVTLRQAWPLNL